MQMHSTFFSHHVIEPRCIFVLLVAHPTKATPETRHIQHRNTHHNDHIPLTGAKRAKTECFRSHKRVIEPLLFFLFFCFPFSLAKSTRQRLPFKLFVRSGAAISKETRCGWDYKPPELHLSRLCTQLKVSVDFTSHKECFLFLGCSTMSCNIMVVMFQEFVLNGFV